MKAIRISATLLLLTICAFSAYASKARRLVSFGGPVAGTLPYATLVAWQGSFYGTAVNGGSSNCGVVFQLSQSNGVFTETTLHEFGPSPDGCVPEGDVTFDRDGNLYGAAFAGGAYGHGCVYRLTPKNGAWTETILYSFKGAPDGDGPAAKLIFDPQGNIYGTTYTGGDTDDGTVFRLTPSGDGWIESRIHSFTYRVDGNNPLGIVLGDERNLIGFASHGGPTFRGTIYQLENQGGMWAFTVLYSFDGPNDVVYPQGRPVRDASGNLYGVGILGGSDDCGALFKFDPSTGLETVLHNFKGYPEDGSSPMGTPYLDGEGRLWGTSGGGGPTFVGTVYRFDLPTNSESGCASQQRC